MCILRTSRRHPRAWLLAPGAGAVLFCLVAGLPAADPVPAPPPAAADGTVPPVPVFDLAECRRIALEKQPALAAYRASLANAEARSRAINNLMVPDLVKPDLPIRRKQACLAVQIAQAQLSQAEWNTVADVTRLYFTALYSRDQQRVADEALSSNKGSLKDLRDLVESILKAPEGRRDVQAWNKQQLEVLIHVVEGRREEAVQGYDRALAALREAMGLEPGCCFALADDRMPRSGAVPDCEQVVCLALARRGELIQAVVATDITALEVQAQNASHHPQENTFAAGSDLHSTPIPTGLRDGEYRPGAVGIEMPILLAGPRAGRVEQASALHGRAVAVVDKTRNLIVLDVKDAYFRWKEAAAQVDSYTAAARQARRVANRVREDFVPTGKMAGKPTLEDLLAVAREANQIKVLENQARHQLLLTLSSLERATAGGFCPQFEPATEEKDNNGAPEGDRPRP